LPEYHFLTVVAQSQKPSRDRQGAVAQSLVTFCFEVINVLIVAERRKKILPDKSAEFVRSLEHFQIVVDLEGPNHVFGPVLEQARLYQLSAYDASYLELCQRRSLPLATKDEALRRAS
jgi:predicted nucleic acid-binding protein